MKTSLVSVILGSLIATGAAASDRVVLTHDLLGEVSKVDNGVSKLRVYVSTKVQVQYVAKGKSKTDVDKDVHRKKSDDYLTEKLGRRTRGKIIGIDHVGGTVANKLYVTFDEAICNQKECAWVFADSNVGHSPSSMIRRFSLTSAPLRDGYGQGLVRAYRKDMQHFSGILLDRLDSKANTRGRSISLIVKLDEVHDITHVKKRHKGVD